MPAGIQTYRELFQWAGILADVSLAASLVRRYLQKERAGRILLDLGLLNEEQSIWLRALGAAWILLGLAGAAATGPSYRWPYFLFFTLQGINQIATGTQRFLICEAGIITILKRGVIKLIRREDILDYNVDNGKLFLNLRDQGWVACSPAIRLDYEDELRTFLAARYPNPHEPIAVY